uniref:EF-hand domain-containing protein n=1 Tax=Lotharella oceanica TaxID=641309 RepID=A0A7S2XGU6_9EUKA
MYSAARAFSRRLARPIALGITTGIGLAAFTRNVPQCEMKKAARDMRDLFSTDLADQDLSAFVKYSDDDGNMSKEAFVGALHELGVNDDSVIQSFFQCFDKNLNGVISFNEFVTGIAAIGSESADPKDRLKFVFHSCDLAGNGVIEKDELRKMIHALLVTRENLWLHEQEQVGPRNYEERKLRYEKQLQNHKRTSYAYTGVPNEDKSSIFDVWHKAVLIRKGEEEASTLSNNIMGDGMNGKQALESAPEAQQQRLFELYAAFPELRGKSLDACLTILADSFSSQIIKEADTNKDNVITFKEFESWAEKENKDAKFLFSLYKGFHMINPMEKENETAFDQDTFMDEYVELTQDFGLFCN